MRLKDLFLKRLTSNLQSSSCLGPPSAGAKACAITSRGSKEILNWSILSNHLMSLNSVVLKTYAFFKGVNEKKLEFSP